MAITGHRLASLFGLTLIAALTLVVANAQNGGEPGRFDYYVLVLGWTPSYCATEGRQRHDRECDVERLMPSPCMGVGHRTSGDGPRTVECRSGPWVPQSVIDDVCASCRARPWSSTNAAPRHLFWSPDQYF